MWAALAPIIKIVLEVLIDVIFKNITAPIIAVGVRRDPARRERLRKRVQRAKSRTGP